MVLDEFSHFLLKILLLLVELSNNDSFLFLVEFDCPFPKSAPILSKNVAKESNGLKVVRDGEKGDE